MKTTLKKIAIVAVLAIVGIMLALGLAGVRQDTGNNLPIRAEKRPVVEAKKTIDPISICEMIAARNISDNIEIGNQGWIDDHNRLFRTCIALVTMNESVCGEYRICDVMAAVKKDPRVCENALDYVDDVFGNGPLLDRNNCYVDAAEALGDKSICNKILIQKDENTTDFVDREAEDNLRVQFCEAVTSGTPDACGGVLSVNADAEPYRDRCFAHYASELNDTRPCMSIFDVTSRNECLLDIALRTKNATICENPNMATGDVYERLAPLCFGVLKNPNWCEEWSEDEVAKGFCYFDVAAYRGEPELCLKDDPSGWDKCYIETAMMLAHGRLIYIYDA